MTGSATFTGSGRTVEPDGFRQLIEHAHLSHPEWEPSVVAIRAIMHVIFLHNRHLHNHHRAQRHGADHELGALAVHGVPGAHEQPMRRNRRTHVGPSPK